MIDDDVLAAPGMVSGHAAHHAEHPALVVVGAMPVPERLQAEGGAPARLYGAWYEQQARGYVERPEEILRSLWAGNVSLRREAALEVGLSNPEFDARYNEDRDFGLRLRRAGLTGRFDPTLAAEHLYRRSLPAFLADAEATGEGSWLVHELHRDVLGPFPTDDFAGYLSPLMAAAVRLSRRRRGAPLVAATAGLARVCAALRLEPLALRALTAAFHMIRQRAALARSRRA
jgi:hypothetical protein